MLRVAFVFAPIRHESFQENLRVVDEDFGRLPPISLLYAAGMAEQAGCEVLVVDAHANRLTLEQVTQTLRAFRPDLLAFTLATYTFRNTTAWMAHLREALKVPTVAGGINVRMYPVETLTHPAVDYGVLHFGTRGFPALLRALAEGRDPVGLPEVVARGPDGTVVQGPVDMAENPYDHLPFPARHRVDNRVYHSFLSQRRSFTVMVTSTGCPCHCTFCAIAPLPRYLNSLDRIAQEIRTCVQDLDIHEIDFFDADLFANRRRGLELCRCIEGLDLDLEWSCRTRLDFLDDEVLEAASRSGCRKMYVGIETPDVEALRAMKKSYRPKDVRPALERIRRYGIRPLGFFMLGVPGETWASALRTIRYAASLPLDYAQFSRMIAKPGSGLHDEVTRRTGKDPWREFLLGAPLKRLPNPWSRLSEEDLELVTKIAYLGFYFRPSAVWQGLARLRSPEELMRQVRTAMRMVLSLPQAEVRGAKGPGEDDGNRES